ARPVARPARVRARRRISRSRVVGSEITNLRMTTDEARVAPHGYTSVMLDTAIPVEITDPTNARILAVSEDRIAGFLSDPFAEIARLSDLDIHTVHERLRAMLAAGTIRRIRQTLMATNLAPGALVAWRIPSDRIDAGFDFMWKDDPFSGHIVIRSTD